MSPMSPIILVFTLLDVSAVSVSTTRIIWKVLKTHSFLLFSGFRAFPQAEVRILRGLGGMVF